MSEVVPLLAARRHAGLWDVRPIPLQLLSHYNVTSYYLLWLLMLFVLIGKELHVHVAWHILWVQIGLVQLAKLVAEAWLAWRLPVLHAQSLALSISRCRLVTCHLMLHLVPLVWLCTPDMAHPSDIPERFGLALITHILSVVTLLGSLACAVHIYRVHAQTICTSNINTTPGELLNALDP
jgi:hypothetical protein